jgi:bromodomain-containing factor 1
VNGDSNVGAYSSNQTIAAPIDIPSESHLTQATSSLDDPASSPLPDTNTTTNEGLSTSQGDSSDLLATADFAIDSAINDVAAASTVPPVVEGKQSDLRDTTSPFSSEPVETRTELQTSSLDVKPQDDQLPLRVADNLVEGNASAQNENLTFETSPVDLPQSSSKQQPTPSASADLDLSTSLKMEQPQSELSLSTTMEPNDTEMMDASDLLPASKISREREDDDEMEPSAKRTKTEDEAIKSEEPAVGAPAATGLNGESEDFKSEAKSEAPITTYEGKEISKIVNSVMKTPAGRNFRAAVSVLWPTFAESYATKVSYPIDLKTIEKKIRTNVYPTKEDFKADVRLIYDNAVIFNGPDHTVTMAAQEVRDAILTMTSNLPPEPPAVPKPAKKAKRSTPVPDATPRATTARRQSRSAGAGTTPSSAPQAQTFALDPSTNTPLIRRDSTKGDGGRPKREIHPPKNKDLPYSVRPKSKKYATELKFCEEVLNEMKKPKYQVFSAPFLIPVDPIALNIPNYFTIIKNPMAVSTVASKLHNGQYAKAKDFENDVRLIFSNCYKFNPVGNPVREMGRQLEEVFETKWAQRQQWIQDHTPAAQSPTSTQDTDEEDEDEEEELEQPTAPSGVSGAAQRLIEEQNKLITLMTAKKPDASLIQMQQELVKIVQTKVETENAAAAAKKVIKKAKAPKAAKKAAPAKKAGGAASKKSAAGRQKYMGTLEKEVISAGLASLPDDVSANVLDWIKSEQPGVDVSL